MPTSDPPDAAAERTPAGEAMPANAGRSSARSPLVRAMVAQRENAVVVGAALLALHGMSYVFPDYIIPGLPRIFAATAHILRTQTYDVFMTLLRLLEGIGAALVLGVALGVLMGISRPVARFGTAALNIVMAIPALSWILFAILWFKATEVRIFFIVFIISLPFYAMNSYDGIRALPPDLIEAIEVFRPTRGQVARILVVPHVVPYVVMTTKSVLGYSLRITVFAELIGAAVGIGARLLHAHEGFRIDQVFGWTIILVALNFLLQGAVGMGARHFLRWRPERLLR